MLDLLARLSCYMQRQTADFSRPVVLESILKELEQLKEDRAEWCSEVSTQVDKLKTDQEITITRGRSAHSCVRDASVESLTEFRDKVALCEGQQGTTHAYCKSLMFSYVMFLEGSSVMSFLDVFHVVILGYICMSRESVTECVSSSVSAV